MVYLPTTSGENSAASSVSAISTNSTASWTTKPLKATKSTTNPPTISICGPLVWLSDLCPAQWSVPLLPALSASNSPTLDPAIVSGTRTVAGPAASPLSNWARSVKSKCLVSFVITATTSTPSKSMPWSCPITRSILACPARAACCPE